MKSRVLTKLSFLTVLCLLASCLKDEGIVPYQQLIEDIAEIDAYLDANPPTDPTDLVIKDLGSGIRMVITECDLGVIKVPPAADNLLDVAYSGWIFSNGKQGDPFETNSLVIKLSSSVIQGWKTALSMMTDGMKATVYIPSGLAYGKNGKGSIPGNAILVFDLYLREVNRTNETAQLTADKNTIAQYLATKEILPQIHATGISYVLQSAGQATRPLLYDQVSFRYTAKLLDGTVLGTGIEQGPTSAFSSRVVNSSVHGITVGLQLMYEGDKATLYIPSTLGFGGASARTIPANSNLIFEIELLDVIPYGQQ